MQQNDKPVFVYATFPDAAAARTAGENLVRDRLAACVNIFAAMTSIYWWDGEVQSAAEAAMIVKTRAHLAETVVSRIRGTHSYDNPAIVVLDVAGGSAPFLAWIMTETASEAAAT